MGGQSLILLDTHIWVWWVQGGRSLTRKISDVIKTNESSGLGVSIISYWEISKLVERGRIDLHCEISKWISQAAAYPHIKVIDLSPEICVESTLLPKPFHRDPADQLIVATSRCLKIPILTVDAKIVAYPHVEIISLH